MSIEAIAELEEKTWGWPSRQTVGWALIDVGQFISRPFYWSCEKLALQVIQPQNSKVFDVFRRAIGTLLFGTLGCVSLLGWLGGGALRMAGTCVAGVPYIYQKGEAKQKEKKNFSLLSFNACMYESGLPMLLGGVMPASHRVDRLAELIQKNQPDLVVLQELALGPSKDLMEKIKKEYAHFYTHVGNPGAWIQSKIVGPELFIASKVPIVSEPQFIPFRESKASHKLGFFCVETPTCWVINAHFPEEHQEACLKQIHEKCLEFKKPCVLAGDLNYRKKIPEELFFDPKGEEPTCFDLLSGSSEIDDFIIADTQSWKAKKIGFEKQEIITTEHSSEAWKALSDHKPILAQIWTVAANP